MKPASERHRLQVYRVLIRCPCFGEQLVIMCQALALIQKSSNATTAPLPIPVPTVSTSSSARVSSTFALTTVDQLRRELATAHAERDSARTERDSIRADRESMRLERDRFKQQLQSISEVIRMVWFILHCCVQNEP
jgi:hypothetical protein